MVSVGGSSVCICNGQQLCELSLINRHADVIFVVDLKEHVVVLAEHVVDHVLGGEVVELDVVERG